MLKVARSALVLLLMMYTANAGKTQENKDSAVRRPLPEQGVARRSPSSKPGPAADSVTEPVWGNGPCDATQPHVTVIDPPPTHPVLTLQDRMAWGAKLGLALVGYVGVVIALRVLRSIDAQTKNCEAIAQAALEMSKTATITSQAVLDAQRPWVVITVRRKPESINSFEIVATNRGSAPAEIIMSPDKVAIVPNQSSLPVNGIAAIENPGALPVPIMLFAGDSAPIQRFGRADLEWLCKAPESLRQIERGEKAIFIYGRAMYRNLNYAEVRVIHNTDWCCRYIHGESGSDLIMDGPPSYIEHT